MARILAVGIATLDIINSVASYPQEDDEVRVLAQRRCRGGNATNTLTILRQLGHDCHWAGVLVDEPDAALIQAELNQFQINTTAVRYLTHGKVPTSYITHNVATGSRTIVHHRDLPEYDFSSFQNIDLSSFDWIHFEGRNVDELLKMLSWAKLHSVCPISIEIEKERPNIEMLFPYADVLMISRQFSLGRGYCDANTCLAALQAQAPQALFSCAWGEEGAYIRTAQQICYYSPAYRPVQVMDTLAAGDTFNAGLIDQLCRGADPQIALDFACRLAGMKCGVVGLQLDVTFCE